MVTRVCDIMDTEMLYTNAEMLTAARDCAAEVILEPSA